MSTWATRITALADKVAPISSPPPPVVVPPPVVIPPPPVTGTGLVMSDDFSGYADTAAFRAACGNNWGGGTDYHKSKYADGSSINLFSIDRSTGVPRLKYTQPGGTAETPTLVAYVPDGNQEPGLAGLQKMWLRARLRYSSNFTTVGVTPVASARAYKILGWGYRSYNGSGRIEWMNTNQYDFVCDVTTTTNVSLFVPANPDIPGRGESGEWKGDADWDYIVCFEGNGNIIRQRYWIGKVGTTPVRQAVMTTKALPMTVPLINRVDLGMNFNMVRAANQSQALWLSRWEVYDGSLNPNPFGLADA